MIVRVWMEDVLVMFVFVCRLKMRIREGDLRGGLRRDSLCWRVCGLGGLVCRFVVLEGMTWRVGG